MSKSYFIWNGIGSLDKGITVTKLPEITKPEERVEKIVVEGRSGFLTKRNLGYEGIVKTCECTLDDYNIDDISNWLTGEGEVIFSNEPDKKYKTVIVNQISFKKVIPTLHNFIIVFDCQPFAYSIDDTTINLTQSGSIYNFGTMKSYPNLKISGSGNVTITVNGNSFTLNDISDYVIVDSEIMDCYKKVNEVIQLLNNKMIGDFPYFEVGENVINWTGNITSIEIMPRWCYK